eukprot:14888741-Heterocapsa_arctica.AAC.1
MPPLERLRSLFDMSRLRLSMLPLTGASSCAWPRRRRGHCLPRPRPLRPRQHVHAAAGTASILARHVPQGRHL